MDKISYIKRVVFLRETDRKDSIGLKLDSSSAYMVTYWTHCFFMETCEESWSDIDVINESSKELLCTFLYAESKLITR